jgi:hypothetical protein
VPGSIEEEANRAFSSVFAAGQAAGFERNEIAIYYSYRLLMIFV